MSQHVAWALVCRLFGGGLPVYRTALSTAEQSILPALDHALRTKVINARHALCPWCGLYDGPILGDPFGGVGARICQCPDCGPVPIESVDIAGYALNTDWLVPALQMAIGAGHHGPDALSDGIWRISDGTRGPVLLARRVDLVWNEPRLFERVLAGRDMPAHVITTKMGVTAGRVPFSKDVVWLPLEERFTLHQECIVRVGDNVFAPARSEEGTRAPVHGPFSADFRWVHLPDWAEGPIALSEGQASVFAALWSFEGRTRHAEEVMRQAGLSSAKPADLFKVKPKHKGDPLHEGPHHAYKALVATQQRTGTYALPCAAKAAALDAQ